MAPEEGFGTKTDGTGRLTDVNLRGLNARPFRLSQYL
jgi:hypothetical protein